MCTLLPHGLLSHPQIQLCKLSNGKLYSDFRLYSHTPEDVAMAIEAYVLPLVDHINDQWQALQDFNRLRSMPDLNMKDRNLLLEFLHVFDRMFFFGALGKNCELKVVEVISETERDMMGLTESYTKRPISVLNQAPETIITIGDHSKVDPTLSGEALVDEYLSTLLHEALHAMFCLYVCRQHKHCDELYFIELGSTGHGTRWEQAAKVIESASARMGMARVNSEAGLSLD